MVVKRKPKPLFFIIIFILIIGIISVLIGSACIYLSSPIDKENNNRIDVKIPKGTSTGEIAKILKDEGLIKSSIYFSIYTKLHSKHILQAATYKLSKSMSLEEIVKSLETGSTYDPEALIITFKEGKRITDYAESIAKKTNYSSDEVLTVMRNSEYISSLINKYWFLTEDILNGNIYYPLEGYLAPDTYFFKKDATIEDIIKTLLDEEEKKLKKYKSTLINTNIHEVLTMASIIELEGTNTENRKEIVGIFNNRLSLGMNLGSDVTTYYALQKPLTVDLNTTQFAIDNPYNTRSTTMRGKLPIGPICNPGSSSIEASVNPSNNDYLYFVADKNGKIYYTKTLQEHEKQVAYIKEKGDWIW